MNAVFYRAIEEYGETNQKIKAIEEMSELTKAIAKDLTGEPNPLNIAEEIAHVYIMLDQLVEIYQNQEMIDTFHNLTITRMENRITRKEMVENGLQATERLSCREARDQGDHGAS